MSHDAITEALLDAASGADLPEEARRHVAACADCAGLARALAIVATTPEATAPAPPAGYWDDFDARLGSRLASRPPLERGRVLPLRRGPGWTAALGRLAAALVIVAAGWAAVRGVRAPDRAPSGSDALAVAAATSPDLLVEEAETLTGAWSRSWLPAWTEEATADLQAADAWSSAVSEEAGDWSDLLADPLAPVDSVGEELAGRLSDDQAAELARRLREEMSS